MAWHLQKKPPRWEWTRTPGLELSHCEDTTDLEMRGIMDGPESALRGTMTDMTLANGKFFPTQRVGP